MSRRTLEPSNRNSSGVFAMKSPGAMKASRRRSCGGGGAGGAGVDARALERAALKVERVAAIAVEVLDRREVHQDSGALGLRDHSPDQLGTERRQVLSIEGALGETC